MATAAMDGESKMRHVDDATYRRRIRAWTMYDWANSAFYTTVMAAVLPAYYSAVAGATLPSAATATAYWSITNSIALFFIALMAPVLGTISDVMRAKKKFLSLFIGIGVVGTGLLVLVSTGDWLLASIFFVIGRIGAGGSIIFYDSLLPHIATEDDQDKVSTRGFALGYVGGGVLLAINVVMLSVIPDTWFEFAGIRLSFLSVAIWWLVFSIPILRTIPEPPADSTNLKEGETIVGVSFARLRRTFADLREYSELFKYLIAFLIYNDGIGTIIGVAVIYGAELGFETLELVLALLLVQFVGVPYTLIFGNLPVNSADDRRHMYLAFVLFNAIALPTVGIIGSLTFNQDITGTPPPPFETVETYVGEGVYDADTFTTTGTWEGITITPEQQVDSGIMGQLTMLISSPEEATYIQSEGAGSVSFDVNGQDLVLRYASLIDGATLGILVDGEPLVEVNEEGNETSVTIDTTSNNADIRYGETTTINLPDTGQQTVTLVNESGAVVRLASVEVLPPARTSNLGIILGLIVVLQVVGVAFAFVMGRFFKPLSDAMDTRRSILLSLVIYGIIAVWGYFLSSTLEFWFLAFMVAIVQGGSQALSRSLYASMCPASKSGEFFGLFSIMSKFASIMGPLLFAGAVALFGSSRPAILSLIALFVIGGFLLTRVNIAAGQQFAREKDAEIFGTAEA